MGATKQEQLATLKELINEEKYEEAADYASYIDARLIDVIEDVERLAKSNKSIKEKLKRIDDIIAEINKL